MYRTRVGVLRGGPSREYDVSLQTGACVLSALSEDKYEAKDIFVSKDGVWYMRGAPMTLERVLPQVDVIFNALHGAYGEDGQVQKILTSHDVPYTGSSALGSALAMNKVFAKEYAGKVGLKTPAHIVVRVGDDLDRQTLDIFRNFPQPSVVKPLASGSSVGVTVARDYASLREGIARAFDEASSILIEEYISGREATCGVLERIRGLDIYPLFPVEIIVPKNKFYDYGAKYTDDSTQLICPGNFTETEKAELQEATCAIHKALGLRHYSRSDFRVSPKGIYFLETNTLPGLTSHSLVPTAAKESGVSFQELVEHLVGLAMGRV